MALVADSVDRLFHHGHSPVNDSDRPPRPRAERHTSAHNQTPSSTASTTNTPRQGLREASHTNVQHMSAAIHSSFASAQDADRENIGLGHAHGDTHGDTHVKAVPQAPVLPPEPTPVAESTVQDAFKPQAQPESPRSDRLLVQDLAHIQSLFQARLDDPNAAPETSQYDISAMPIDNVIEMVAGVLTRITATNDIQHDHLHKQLPVNESATVSPQTNSVLAFHGKTVPSISILNYLNRIHKYCPTSHEVFVSLLVYFDRMTDRVNSAPLQTLQLASQTMSSSYEEEGDTAMDENDMTMQVHEATPPLSGESISSPGSQASKPATPRFPAFDKSSLGEPPKTPAIALEPSPPMVDISHFFAVDSFNIHRLIIAGVTCASKFFSDIFYTNSRYAKVGGLPQPELNHLELQFLLLNDFRLSVSVQQLNAYSNMLVEFYGREVTHQTGPEANVDVEMG